VSISQGCDFFPRAFNTLRNQPDKLPQDPRLTTVKINANQAAAVPEIGRSESETDARKYAGGGWKQSSGDTDRQLSSLVIAAPNRFVWLADEVSLTPSTQHCCEQRLPVYPVAEIWRDRLVLPRNIARVGGNQSEPGCHSSRSAPRISFFTWCISGSLVFMITTLPCRLCDCRPDSALYTRALTHPD
jgi:hypothetical protein